MSSRSEQKRDLSQSGQKTGLLTFFSYLNSQASAFLINKLHCFLVKLAQELKLKDMDERLAILSKGLANVHFEVLQKRLAKHWGQGAPDKAQTMLNIAMADLFLGDTKAYETPETSKRVPK